MIIIDDNMYFDTDDEFLQANIRLFSHVYNILETIENTDRNDVPPMGYQTTMLTEYVYAPDHPIVELNRRKIYIDGDKRIFVVESRDMKVTNPDPVNPEPSLINKEDIKNNKYIIGEHLVIQMGCKSVFTGILGLLYALLVMHRVGIIRDEERVLKVLASTLNNTGAPVFKDNETYLTKINWSNRANDDLCQFEKILHNEVSSYYNEYYFLQGNIISILREIHKLL